MEICTVLWREYIFFRRRWFQITTAALISPLLYFIAFGWGLGKDVYINGHNYMYFIIPGIIALTTMNTSYNALTIRINIAKIHEKSFEYYLTSPVNMYLLTLGQVLAGTLRGMYAAFLIITVSYLIGVHIEINLFFIVICLLNSLVFSTFGYFAAMVIDSHYDMNRFTSYIITPMTFLCGTFFSPEHLPGPVAFLVNLLPLTHASVSLRAIALGGSVEIYSILVLCFYSLLFYALGARASFREM